MNRRRGLALELAKDDVDAAGIASFRNRFTFERG
jgi:hypothetical protein